MSSQQEILTRRHGDAKEEYRGARFWRVGFRAGDDAYEKNGSVGLFSVFAVALCENVFG